MLKALPSEPVSLIARSQNTCPGSNRLVHGIECLIHRQSQRRQILAVDLRQAHINAFTAADSRRRSGHGSSFSIQKLLIFG
jgi:hypothetical protein